jgi:hypothetical protein
MLKRMRRPAANAVEMTADKFTLILTRGTHTVTAAEATRIRTAVENEDRTIDAEVEFIETPGRVCRTTLVVAHVVGLVEKTHGRAAAPVRRLASVAASG